MFDVSAIQLVLLFAAFIAGIWWLIHWVTKPVAMIQFTGVELITETDSQRVIKNSRVQMESGDKPLTPGLNDFFITVREGVLRYHQPGEVLLLNPILRSSEEILFFRLQIRVVGERIVKFEQTNLSKPNAKLLWCKA
ncbi:hypothetical protein D3C87_1009180 [compost metagenome]